ncbi:AAEL007991-PA [Aedes aegypti]|uniref:AAEL007991-PA n=2 Tax=Aedes aegypti TaxID=7159 RepID=Q0IET0_AEDAE|nr:clavesin-1 [Aedes aegypti]EAT40271.1 AAEL007991-PA [Aedes aegypti]
MAENVGYYFKVPSVNKAPNTYDDDVNELHPLYKTLAVQLGENENIRKQSVQQLREWISKTATIKRCRTDAPFLLRFLRTNKYSFLRTVKMLDNYLHALAIHKDWFGQLSADDPELSVLIDGGYLFPLPQLDAKGRIVFFSFSSGFDAKKSSIANAIKMNFMLGEVHFDTNEAQCAGIVCIYDMEKIDMSVLGQISIQDIRKLVDLLDHTSAGRFQELHFVNAQKVTRTFANMVLQLMSEKIRSRVFVSFVPVEYCFL